MSKESGQRMKRIVRACGMTQQAAADYVGVQLRTMSDYCTGKVNPIRAVWIALHVRRRALQEIGR